VLISYAPGSTITLLDTNLAQLTTSDCAFSGVNVVTGTNAGETLTGTPYSDVMSGLGGDDVLSGLGSSDLIIGGDGDDQLFGGDGIDWADYRDAASGVTVNLKTPGANGGDAAGDSFVSVERIEGSQFADTLIGDDGANVLHGGGGADTIDGGLGDDYLIGGAGSMLDGGEGNDIVLGFGGTLSGGAGDDFVISTGGTVQASGGEGADNFGFHIPVGDGPVPNTLDNLGTTTITDFTLEDTIRIGWWTPFNLLDPSHAQQTGNDVTITYGSNSVIILKDTDLGTLSESNFEFDTTPIPDPLLF